MAPPVEKFSSNDLPDRVQITRNDRRRKDKIELKKCELLEMVQYECALDLKDGQEPTKDTAVICRPVERLFRRCKDRNGTFMVETTAWEGREAPEVQQTLHVTEMVPRFTRKSGVEK